MAVFGLIFSALVYVSLIALFIFIFVMFIQKKYVFTHYLMLLLFLHGLIVVMCLSWGIIIMSGGFNVSVELYVNNDYTWIVFFFIGLLFIIIFMDIVVKRHIDEHVGIVMSFGKYLLPMFNIVVITAATFLFYSSCNYFHFLTL